MTPPLTARWSQWSSGWLVWAIALSIPLIVWVVQLIAFGWRPHGDMAFHAVHTHDVFGPHTPLLGMPTTSANTVDGLWSSHPGPLYFQLMAPFYALSGFAPWGLLVGAAAVLVGCIFITLAAAHSADGWRGVRAFAAGWLVLLVVVQTLVAEPWNPWPAVGGSLAALATGWAVSRARWSWFPAFAFTTSLSAQSHLADAPVMLGLGVVVVVHSVLVVRVGGPPVPRWSIATTAIVLMLAWAAPVTEQFTGEPGNLSQMLRYADQSGAGWSVWVAATVVAVAGLVAFRFWKDLDGFWISTRPGTLVGLGALVTLLALWAGLRTTDYHVMYLIHFVPMLFVVVVWRLTARMAWRPGLVLTATGFLVLAWNPWPDPHRHWEASVVVERVMEQIEPVIETNRLPIEVHGEGDLAAADTAPGVYAELVARGHDVYFVSPFASADSPRQDDFRNPERLTGERLVITVVTSEEAPVDHETLDLVEVSTSDGTKFWWGLEVSASSPTGDVD